MRDERLLILKVGESLPKVRSVCGDFEAMFTRSLGMRPQEIVVVRPHLGEQLPSFREPGAVLVTGSAASVTDPAPWMTALCSWLVCAADNGVPILGVCFGHQLIATAFGGRVEQSQRGREVGTAVLSLTPEGESDLLFAGIPRPIRVHETHEDVVVEAPSSAVELAQSTHSNLQSLAIGENVRTVQFHPEFDSRAARLYIDLREEQLRNEARSLGDNPDERLRLARESIVETDHGARMLRNWRQSCFGTQ